MYKNNANLYCLLLIGVLNSLVYSQVLNLNSATVEYDYKDTSTNKLFLSNVLIETDYKDTSTNKTFIQSVIVEYDYILYQDTIPPVLLSALTETTTAIILTFSEDLENSTISIDDFLITNPTVSIISAVKISSGVIRLSILPQMPTDAVPWVIIVSSISDLAGNYAVIGSSVQSKDGVSPVISGLDISLKVFSPNSDGIKDNTTIYYTLSESATTTISIYDSTNILVRTLVNSLKSAGQNSETWDGKNDAGFILPDGNYTIKIDATDLSGNKAIPVSTQTAIDNTPPGITNLSVTPSPFWPDGNGITGDKLNDITTIYYTLSDNLSYPLATTIKIYDNSNNLVKTLIDNAIKPPGSYTEPWDGTDSVGKVVIEGTYTYKISATDIAGNTTASSGTVKVDFPPVFSISAVPYTAKPTPGNPVTVTITVYSNEPLISNPTITAVDASSAPLVITGPVVSTNTYTYTTVVSTSNAEGQARINVSGTDLTGNPGTDTGYFVIDSIPDIRNVSASPDPFTPNNDGLQDTTTIQYELTIACKVTIEIKNSQGVIVKHLSTSIDEGVGYQSHLWNGLSDDGNSCPNGAYTYEITTEAAGSVTRVTGTVTINNLPLEITNVSILPATFSPDDDGLDDKTTIYYKLSEPAKVTINILDTDGITIVRHLVSNVNHPSGDNSVDMWDGKKDDGTIVPNDPNGTQYYIDIIGETWGNIVKASPLKSVTVKSGTILLISTPTVTPTTFSPDGDGTDDTSTISYGLSDVKGSTYAYVTIKIYSDTSGTQLVRTLGPIYNTMGVNSQVWDGKNNESQFVVSGDYYYQITGIDSFGFTSIVPATLGPQYKISATVNVLTIPTQSASPVSFEPDGNGDKDITTISYTFNDTKSTTSVKVNIKIYSDMAETNLIKWLVRDVTEQISVTQSHSWNGLNDAGDRIPPADYFYKITGVDTLGYSAETTLSNATKVTINTTSLYFYNVYNQPDKFSPNSDGLEDSTSIYYTITQPAKVTVKVEKLNNPLTYKILQDKFNVPASALSQTVSWDGMDTNNNLCGDGIYRYIINADNQPFTTTTGYIILANAITNTASTGYATLIYPQTNQPVKVTSSSSAPVNVTKAIYDAGMTIIGSFYNLEPEGVTFNPNAILMMYYDPTQLPAGVTEEELKIYDWNGTQWVALGGTVDTTNNRIIIEISNIGSLFAVLSPAKAKPDTTPPTFQVILTVDPSVTDIMMVTVIASEKLSQVPQVIATIIQNGKSKNKIDVNVLMTLVEGTEATYKGTFKKITGFGDVEKIIITGTDLAGNVGISDGTFTKELLTKAAAIAEQTADPTFKLGDVYTYPNPAISGQNPIIHIEVGVADRVEIKIFNIAAELVHSVEFASSDYLKIKNDKYCYEYPLDISNIASGVYIYCLNAEKQGYVPIKMIKKCAVIK